MRGWYVHTIPAGSQAKALQALRHDGFDVIRLRCFREVRAHPKVKKRRPDLRRAVPALDEYVFILAGGEAELAHVLTLHKRIERMDWMGAPCPPLSAVGEAWLFNPPRGLFPDTELARYRDAEHLRKGDKVRAWTPVFAGHEGEVVSIRAGRARVEFHGAMFVTDLPVEDLMVVADPLENDQRRAG